MRLGVPRIVRAAIVGVLPGAAESEFDHMGLAHHARQLLAQRRNDRAFDLEFRRQRFGRAGKGREARHREQVLDRGRNALQRAGPGACGKGGIGGVGASARMRGRPLRIGHQLASEPLVIGNRGFDKVACFELALAEQDCDLGER
jgi:hypothetical protein